MKQRESEYTKRVDEWLSAHGITWKLVRIGSERGFANEKPEKGKRLMMHDTYSAEFQRTMTTGNQTFRTITIPKYYQSAAHSESELSDEATRLCNCGYQYGEKSQHRPRYLSSRGACPAHPSNAELPSTYDLLACITKSDPGTFVDWCADYGYDDDSCAAERT